MLGNNVVIKRFLICKMNFSIFLLLAHASTVQNRLEVERSLMPDKVSGREASLISASGKFTKSAGRVVIDPI